MTTLAAAAHGWIPELGYGDRLRRVRLDLGMDQRKFAESIGMKHAAYGHHELATTAKRGAKLVANSIELRHGVPAWWVLGEADPRLQLAPPPEGGQVSSPDDECPDRESNTGPTAYEAVSSNVVQLRPDPELEELEEAS